MIRTQITVALEPGVINGEVSSMFRKLSRLLAVASLLMAPLALAQTSVSPATLSYGSVTVGSTKTLDVAVTNSGTTAVRVYSVLNSASPTEYVLVSATRTPRCGSSGSSLKARSACYQGVQFKPTSAGEKLGSLVVTTVGGTTTPHTVALNGTGVAVLPPSLLITPIPSLTLSGTCGSTTPALGIATVTNSGGGTLKINALSLSAPNGGFSLTSKCGKLPRSLSAGASCNVEIRYSLLTTGTRNATLTVSSSVGSGLLPITGSCNPPASP